MPLFSSRSYARKISPNEKLNLGIIGVANRAAANLEAVSSQNIVALCDVDDDYLRGASQKFPSAKTYNDFRKLLERNDLDAVVVSTPDHIHAPATMMALRKGLHVYCEKPLTHTVSEARIVAETALKHKCGDADGDSNPRREKLSPRGRVGAERRYWSCS